MLKIPAREGWDFFVVQNKGVTPLLWIIAKQALYDVASPYYIPLLM